MKPTLQVIEFFENLATNAHYQITIDNLLVNQTPEIKEIYLSGNSENLRNHFSTTGYFSDSVRVTEV